MLSADEFAEDRTRSRTENRFGCKDTTKDDIENKTDYPIGQPVLFAS